MKIILIIMTMTMTNLNAQNNLQELNDDFGPTSKLEHWKTHHQTENYPSFIDRAEITNGSFLLIPKSTAWFGEFHRGPFFYKEVAGNFTVITKVKVTGKNTLSPKVKYSLGGIMLRSPRSTSIEKNTKGHENWMFLSTGCGTKKGKPQFESKNTVKGKSKLKVFPSKQGWILIAISRIGSVFYQSYRYEDETNWTLLRVVDRSDMSSTLQVGMLAYTDFWSVALRYMLNRRKYNTKAIKGKPDLIANFDFIHFFRLENNIKMENYNLEFPLIELSKLEAEKLQLKY